MPKVSVCIPTYNQIEHLKKTINSVLQQTYTDFEIVITDDSPGELVKNFVEQYNLPKKIKYYKNKQILGSPENWNESIRKASGEYIKILHHDDWLNFENSLAKYVQLLDENSNADFAFSATKAVTENGITWNHILSDEQMNLIYYDPLLLFKKNLIGAPSTTIFRKNFAILFDKNLKWIVDVDFYLNQLRNNNKIIYSPELLLVTFLADGRVSDECVNNKEVQVYEYLYLLNSVYDNRKKYSRKTIIKCVLQVIYTCHYYKITSAKDIQDCGYLGNIHPKIKFYLAIFSVSSLLARLYLILIRTLNKYI